MMSWETTPAKGGRRVTLLNSTQGAITTAQTGTTPAGANGVSGLGGMNYLGLFAKFTYVASSATSAKAWVQTSFDGGTTWFDIANFAFTTSTLNKVAAVTTKLAATHATPTDATLADNTVNNGLLGDRLRVKFTSVGTYGAGTNLVIEAQAKA